MSRLQPLATGMIAAVRLVDGRFGQSTASLRRLCSLLLDLSNRYQFLYEDMFLSIEPTRVDVPIIVNCIETDKRQTVYILEDARSSLDQFEPRLRGKALAVLSLVRKHQNERVVLFARHIRLSDALKGFLEVRGTSVCQVDSRQKSDSERYDVLRRFQTGAGGVLIITRGTGRRGLDIPKADVAIL